MCIQFRLYLRGAKLTLRTDHKSLVWLHQFKDTEGMMARWFHALQQFQFSIVHRPGRDHGNVDGLSREFPRHSADNVHNRIVHRPTKLQNSLISLLILSRPVAQKTLILAPSTRERTGWHCWTTTCHRLQFRVIHFLYLPSRKKTRSTLHYSRGFRWVIFHHGLRLKV